MHGVRLALKMMALLCLLRAVCPRPTTDTEQQRALDVATTEVMLSDVEPEPTKGGSRGRGPLSRRLRSGRRLRLLQKVLRKLSPNDVMTLVRNKKSRSQYSNFYVYGPTRRPKNPAEVDCPYASDGTQLVACPSPDRYSGEFLCIDEYDLCDNKMHCPNGEDEDGTVCMFHKVTMNNFRVLTDALLGTGIGMV